MPSILHNIIDYNKIYCNRNNNTTTINYYKINWNNHNNYNITYFFWEVIPGERADAFG